MAELASCEIQVFLQRLGRHYPHPGTLYLLGGSALCLLGSPHRTLDIDYTPIGAEHVQLQAAIETLATEMRLEPKAVPIEEFVPLPDGTSARHQFVGRFGALDVYIFDPYTIALSKVARGLETDLQDVTFLLGKHIINLEKLADCVIGAMPQAWYFDIDPAEMQQHLATVRKLLDV